MATQLDSSTEPSPTGRWPSLAEWVLRICFAIRCYGLGDAYLWNPMERDSDLFGVMYFNWQWPEAWALRIDNWGLLLTVCAGCVVIIQPFVARQFSREPNKRRRWLRIENGLLAFVVCWELALAAAITIRGGRFHSQLTLPSHGLRIAAPLALMQCNGSNPVHNSVLTILRWGTVVTFAAHGLQAWQLSPEFTSMILGGWQFIFGQTLDQRVAETMLKWIGGVDLGLAAALMVWRWPALVLYVAVWGLVSALGRTVGGGSIHYPETLLRLVHAGGPLVLFLEWRRQARSQIMRSED